jgi:hypothetical protein
VTMGLVKFLANVSFVFLFLNGRIRTVTLENFALESVEQLNAQQQLAHIFWMGQHEMMIFSWKMKTSQLDV